MDWRAYTQTRDVAVGVRPPSMWEYAFTKIVDNGFIVSVAAITAFFSLTGAYIRIGLKEEAAASWFFDAAKLSLGVFLGAISQKKRGR